jgi:hypothetical protein
MSTVSTILTSAAVSGAVAIGIEWIVKPRMDARKERILNDIGSRRKFENNLLRLRIASGMWARYEYPPNMSEEAKGIIDAERERAFQQIGDATRDLIDDLGFYALTYVGVRIPRLNTTIPEMISRYAFAVRGVYLSKRAYKDKAQIIEELTMPIYAYLFGKRWHPVRRTKAMLEIPNVLDKYAPLDSSAPESEASIEQPSTPDDPQGGQETARNG